MTSRSRSRAASALEALLISDEAGQGKTTLVAERARRAFDDGSWVLFGHCEEDLATPYQLFAEALGHFVAHAPEEQLLAHVATHGSELLSLVPSLAGRIPDLPQSKGTDTDTERYLLFAAVIGLLAQASLSQPVVLVLDDLQWADKGSLLLLRHIMTTAQPLRILIIGTYRDSELSQTHSLLDTLAALRRYDHAEASFAQSASFCRRASAKFFATRTDLSLGKLLTERRAPGDVEQARELFTKAQRTAATLGYGGVERHAAQALRALA